MNFNFYIRNLREKINENDFAKTIIFSNNDEKITEII